MAKSVLVHLRVTAVDDGGLDSGSHGTRAAAKGLEILDNLHRVGVGNLAEDDVLAVEPGGDNSGDEELGTVAMERKRLVGFERTKEREHHRIWIIVL